jgi:hypothetical protein
MNVSLDIDFYETQPVVCPHCGQTIKMETIDCANSGGRGWYPILESLGYYVPYEKRTEDNDWYCKNMTLTPEQTKEVYKYVKEHLFELYNAMSVMSLIARATLEGTTVVINANW